VGVIAVIECNFLQPTHNKQDFDYTEEYRQVNIVTVECRYCFSFLLHSVYVRIH